MKKLVYLALALCVMVAAFSGCGGKSDDGGNSSAVSSPPATVTPTPTPESQTAKALRVTADSGLNIRAEASTDGEILGLAENGQRLALMLEDPQNGWYQVQYNGQTAFVSACHAYPCAGRHLLQRDGFLFQHFFHQFIHQSCGRRGRRITPFSFSCQAGHSRPCQV